MVISPLAGSHILLALFTYIIGDTPFPEYSVVVMLDDIPLSYHDSNMMDKHEHKIAYRNYKSDNEKEEQDDAKLIFGHIYNSLRERAFFARGQTNISDGIQVVQRMSKCELCDDETDGPVTVQDAFDGVTEEIINFSTQNNTVSITSEGLWKALWDEEERVNIQVWFAERYSPICIKTLKNALHSKRKDTVEVKPSVEFYQKTLPEGRGVKVTCLATGFYPRRINLTLLRDGQPLSDEQIVGGELLPNGDGTYQMRKSLEVRAEELQHHHYTCTAEHILERRTIHLDCSSMVKVALICGAVVVFVCVAGAITAYMIHRGKQKGDSQGRDNLTQAPHRHSQSGDPTKETKALSSCTMMEMSPEMQPEERTPLQE